MKLKNKILSIAALSVFSQSVSAIPFTFEARSLAMGGVSVATADLATAAWANPAMLTNQRLDDDFSLLIGVGAFVRDNDDMIGDIEDFQDANDRFESGDLGALAEMQSIIAGIDGKVIAPEATAVASMGIAFESFAMAVSIRGDLIAGGNVINLSVDPNDILDENFNILNIEGVLATELGVSFAKSFNVYDRKLSIGIKPKVVNLKSFTFSESILTTSAGFETLNDDENKADLGTFTTVDIGLAYDVTESVRLGLNVRNLITDDFKIGNQTLNFDTTMRLGVAYRNQFLTIAADYDLVENEPLLANETFNGLKTQYLSLGAEFNAFDFMQLRVGASQNLASNIRGGARDTLYTAGIGLWLGFNLDVAATLSNNSAGAFVQTGFRF